MDFVWSPWRYRYVSSDHDSDRCVFCIEEDGQSDEERLVVHRGRTSFVILNRYPYTSGHLLVVPYRHVDSVSDATEDEMAEVISLARHSVGILTNLYSAEGFNVGMNLGGCAGAGIRDHIHMHVVPRWWGDVNFMTTTGETRVLPEDLRTSYRRIRPLFP